MDKIKNELYLGDFNDGCKHHPEWYVVNFSEDTYGNLPYYTHFPIPDNVCLPYRKVWQGIDEIKHAVTSGRTVLVHCRLGISRAPSFMIGYLMCIGWEFNEALDYVKACRDIVNPYIATLNGIRLAFRLDFLPGRGFLWG